MEWLIDELIRYLQTLKSKDTVDFWAGVGFLVSPVIAIATFVWYSTRQSAKRHYQKGINKQQEAVDTAASEKTLRLDAEEEVRSVTAKLAKLEETGPAGFMRRANTEEKQGNDAKLANEARAFLDAWRDPLHRAFMALARKSIADSAEDGAPAFEAARLHATAAYAVDPQDRSTKMLADDLAYGSDLAAAGVKVKIKDDTDRETRATAQDQATGQLQQLNSFYFAARDSGRYAVMSEIATRGETLAHRSLGPTARWTLMFSKHAVEAAWISGKPNAAHDAAERLHPRFCDVFGDETSDTLDLRYLIATCLRDLGKPQDAHDAATQLLPLYIKVYGAEHTGTLSTRYLIASCLKDLGKPQDAHYAATQLLPLLIEVNGAEHPGTLSTRHFIASCLQDLGKPQDAHDAATQLLPLVIKLNGAEHPCTLNTRSLIARCLIDLNRRDEARKTHHGVLDALRALGLTDEARFVKRAFEIERLLAEANSSTPDG